MGTSTAPKPYIKVRKLLDARNQGPRIADEKDMPPRSVPPEKILGRDAFFGGQKIIKVSVVRVRDTASYID